MSDRRSKQTMAVKFEPVAVEHDPEKWEPVFGKRSCSNKELENKNLHAPGELMLAFGVAFPAAIIAVELAGHLCAQTFFDPLPTVWHAVAAAMVPAGNLWIWYHLQNGGFGPLKWLAFANGVAIAIAGFYAFLFLPLLPLAIVGIIVLIGLMPLAPLVSFICALKLRTQFSARNTKEPCRGAFIGGLAAGLAFLAALDVPAAATRLGIALAGSQVPSERERGLALLRRFGDEDLLLRLSYGNPVRSGGLLGAFALWSDNDWGAGRRRSFAQNTAEMREIYYRVHGVPFNFKPPPSDKTQSSARSEFAFDDDHGGTQAGGRLNGLHLISSNIDGSINGDDAVGYLEWTIEFRNSTPLDREVRLELALPPGGVVSRATLWVNGEEREAAYGGRGEVRAAYQRVAVQQRRDPLLVTTKGAGRVLAQAFPVPRGGGTIKFKLGISAPLDIVDPARAALTLPALVDRNFSFAADASHHVWIESKQPLNASAADLTASRIDGASFRVTGSLHDPDLSRLRQTIIVARNPDAQRAAARLGEGEIIVQEVTSQSSPPELAFILVIDGSARLAHAKSEIIAALAAIPPGSKVGAIIASEPMWQLPLVPWSPEQKGALVQLLRSTSFVGGQDNGPALADALGMAERVQGAKLLWIHGPQPVSFQGSAALLEQAASRLSRLPDVMLYSVEPGPNALLPDAPWAWSARPLPQTGSAAADLGGFFASSERLPLAIRRSQTGSADAAPAGSNHIARLWANERVLELMRANANSNRAAAVALATRYQLVTPVTGAVVLETAQQYEEIRLAPVAPATVPTIPEPHEWALILIACAGMAWLAWQNRQRFARA
jgi:hypothetical protein